MNPNDLIVKYPQLFQDGKCSCGAQFPDEWFTVLDRLCNDIISICEEDGIPFPVVQQIKVKWGGLRFYIEGGNAAVYNRITEAEIECENLL